MKKLQIRKNKKKEENREAQNPQKDKEAKTEKLKNMINKIGIKRNQTMAANNNGAKNNADLASVAQIKREKEKKSNENFLMNLEESENNHGDLTYGSYIVISIENEKERREKLMKNKDNHNYRYKAEHRKFYTKFRISDTVKAQKMSEDNYDSN